MSSALFALLALASFSSALLLPMKSECDVDSDCGAGKCCVDNSRFMIVSKRDATLVEPKPFMPFDFEGGTCVEYVKEGQSCHTLGFASCGCEPGTECVYYPEEIEKPIDLVKHKEEKSKRMMVLRPGKSICEAA